MAFNLFAQLFGCKKGHADNVAIDGVLPVAGAVVSAAVPGAAPVIQVLEAHPTGTTATVSVTTPAAPGAIDPTPTTVQHDIEIAGKVLLAVDPDLPAQLDALLSKILHRFGNVGDDGAKFIEGYLNAKLEDMGFNAPVVVAPPTPPLG